MRQSAKRAVEFRPFTGHTCGCPVFQVTPEDGSYIHRFNDTSPFSPSGRYLVVLRLPFQDREPGPDDAAEVCVIDLEEWTIESIFSTTAWCTQMGAQQQWAQDDRFLYFNARRGGVPVCVRFDLETREPAYSEGPLYQVSPDGKHAIGPDLREPLVTQPGYGVVPARSDRLRLRPGAGERCLWRTDLETGRKEPLVSYDDLVAHLPTTREFKRSALLGFHVKINLQNDRVLFVLRAWDLKARRARRRERRRSTLFSFRTDGSDVRVAIPWTLWSRGGHHPGWHPDGRRCIMNLKLDGEALRLVEFNYDGTDLHALCDDAVGSGHPSHSPDGRFVLTDAYPSEPVCRGDGSVPLRLVDLESQACRELLWMPVAAAGNGAIRCDPHPAWSRDGKWICFNGAPDGRKHVFVADVGDVAGRTRETLPGNVRCEGS